jgi:enolase
MSTAIESIDAFEILDSRGWPTLRVTVTLESGQAGVASVPTGASTGRCEAVELRDRDPTRYAGRGVLKAIENVHHRILPHLRGKDACDQELIDRSLIELDGTQNKSALGANAIVGVSTAVARAAAAAKRVPLYRSIGGRDACRLPVPMINVINGGKHADNSLDFQEFMIIPCGAPTFAEGLRYAAETFHVLADLLRQRGYPTAVGDEGGFAPPLESNAEACEIITEAIRAAGFVPGSAIAIGLDPAATSFWKDGRYHLDKSGEGTLTRDQLHSYYRRLCDTYPIVSIEDGFAEEDWDGFRLQTEALGDRIQVVGDDLYATNPQLIGRGIDQGTTNAVLIKLNQIGTVTETLRAIELCRTAGWRWIVSHRSGETEDTFIADFTVATGAGQIKTGSVCRSERLAKYNRLLEVERELGSAAMYENPFRALP